MIGPAARVLSRIVRAEGLRRNLRGKLLRAIEEVVAPSQADQVRALEVLRQDVSSLAADLGRQAGDLGDCLEQQLREAAERIIGQVIGLEVRARRDLIFAGDAQAARESADFVRDHLTAARPFAHPHATLNHALSLAPSGGMAVEFGVYTGTTLAIIAAAREGGMVYGFDSFEGLPHDWRPGFTAESFALDTPPDVPGAELVPGLFDEVLPEFLRAHPGPVDFVHVDADLYASAATILAHVGPRLRAGSVIVFDEFFNYPGWKNHEYRAWTEHVEHTATTFRYEAFTFDNEQVVVSIGTPQGGVTPDRRAV